MNPSLKWVDPTSPQSWSTFDEVREAYQKGRFGGVGFGLQSGVVALDFDKCLKDGQVLEPFDRYIYSLCSYFELSPSRKGLRGLFFGSLPGSRRRSPKNGLGIELYDSKRFISITGQHLFSTPFTISSDQEILSQFYYHLFPERQSAQTQERRIYSPRDESVDAIIRRAENARNGAKFQALMRGSWEGLGYKSKSEAVFGFLSIIGYWCNYDPVKMRMIYESSGMPDDKWYSRRGNSTYGEITIQNVISRAR
jgi:primase-polymerase (primpol)-like protein